METVSQAPAAIETATAAPTESFTGAIELPVSRVESLTPSPITSIESSINPSFNNKDIFSPSISLELPKPGDFTDPYGGIANPNQTIFSYDEMDEIMPEGTLPSPTQVVQGVIDFLGDTDEEIPEKGSLPTEKEAVSAVEAFLGIASTETDKEIPEPGDLPIEQEAVESAIAFLGITTTEITNQELPEATAQPLNIETIDIAEKPEIILETLSITSALKSPEITPEVKEAIIDAAFAKEVVEAFTKIGYKDPEKLVEKAINSKLATEDFEVKIEMKRQSPETITITGTPENNIEYTLKFKDKKQTDVQVEEPEEWVVDEKALSKRHKTFDQAIGEAVEEKDISTGSEVVGKFKNKKDESLKSEPLQQTLKKDGSLEEVELDVYKNRKEMDKPELSKEIHEIIEEKPPVKKGLGRKVDKIAVDRVFDEINALMLPVDEELQ